MPDSLPAERHAVKKSAVSLRRILGNIVAQEDINFLLTNRLPRRLATRAVGWFSRIENPLVCRGSIAAWKLFADLDLTDAATTRFRSLHDCFTRALAPDARSIDLRTDLMVSPCDALVGACGTIEGDQLYQVKGFPYSLMDLMGDSATIQQFRDGQFVTLRLTSSMYHRFHAPADLSVSNVTYISGDTWNVNPIALRRVEKLFCKNERAVIHCQLDSGGIPILLVPVAAILVASIRLHCCDTEQTLRRLAGDAASGPSGTRCDIPCQATLAKGQEMGWFEHGSTILVFMPPGFVLAESVREGTPIRMGQPLARIPNA